MTGPEHRSNRMIWNQKTASTAGKPRRSSWLIGSLCLAAALARGVPALTVHEWGTFTTLFSSAGVPLTGMYIDASRLPDFVRGLPYFNYDSATGWPSVSKLRNVTVKMETPVLYFYSAKAQDVSVKVGFNGGTISQWYPERAGGEANPSASSVDFADKPYPGSISWKAKVLAPETVLPYTAPVAATTAEWRAPRNTAANLLQGEKGEIEKFLFYRGIGNFTSAVSLKFDADGKMIVTNNSGDAISYLQIYDRPGPSGYMGGNAVIWWEGPLAPHQRMALAKPAGYSGIDPLGAMSHLHAAMVAAGLKDDEAHALIDTWYNGYFTESGLKAFWILPRRQIDAILPLEIKPAPDSLERVIVGRSEILPPAFEAELVKAGAPLEAYKSDRYYLAYLQLLGHWEEFHPEAAGVAPMLPGTAAGRAAGLLMPGLGSWASPVFGGRSGARDMQGRAAVLTVPGR
jgi:hypothetical protein